MAKSKKKKGKHEKKEKNKKVNDTTVKDEGVDEEESKVVKADAASEALKYLKIWKKDRDNWSFKKVRQTWLLKNAFELDKIPHKYFRYILKYIKALQGVAKDATVKNAEQVRDATMDADDDESQTKHQRAVDILRILA